MFNWLYQIGEDISWYSKGMYTHLCGWDVSCAGYYGTVYSNYLGWTVFITVLVALALFYRVIDSPTKRKTPSWWLMALILAAVVFLESWLMIHGSLRPGGACKDLRLTGGDVLGLAFFDTFWGVLLAMAISLTAFPRKLISINNPFTSFYPIRRS
jgi:hypothetical protein